MLVSAAQQHGSFEFKSAFSTCVYLVLKGSAYGKQTASPPRHCRSFRWTQPCLDSVLPLPGSFLPFLTRDAFHLARSPKEASFSGWAQEVSLTSVVLEHFSNSGQLGREGVPRWLSGKESACQAGDVGLAPGLGVSPGGGNDNPLQYSCLEDPMDRGAWWATQSMGSQRVGHERACMGREDQNFLPACWSAASVLLTSVG